MNKLIPQWSMVGMIIILFMLCLSPVHAGRQIYYVATNGNDNNMGTIDSPWATLKKAAQIANAGDIVYVRGGVYYTGGINLSQKGRVDAPIIFQSFPGELAIIDGANTPSNTSIFSISGKYYEIRDFEIRNAKRTAISAWAGKHIRISGNTIYNTYRSAIYGGETASHLIITHNVIYNNVRINENYSFNHKGGWPAAIVSSASHDYIAHNLIYENWGEGIGVYGKRHHIASNTLHDNYSVEIYVNNARRTKVVGNFIYSDNNPAFMRDFGGGQMASAIGISIANENDLIRSKRNRIVNNIITGTRLWGISQWGGYAGVNSGLKRTLIAHNTVVGYGIYGLLKIENNAHRKTVIANNIFYQTNPNRSVATIMTDEGIKFKNNTWIGGSAGRGASAGDFNLDPQFVNINGQTPADFQLSASSPLIKKGAKLKSVRVDYFGQRRWGKRDIGAHERSSMTSFDAMMLPAAPAGN